MSELAESRTFQVTFEPWICAESIGLCMFECTD